jgi:hypothetical protein
VCWPDPGKSAAVELVWAARMQEAACKQLQPQQGLSVTHANLGQVCTPEARTLSTHLGWPQLVRCFMPSSMHIPVVDAHRCCPSCVMQQTTTKHHQTHADAPDCRVQGRAPMNAKVACEQVAHSRKRQIPPQAHVFAPAALFRVTAVDEESRPPTQSGNRRPVRSVLEHHTTVDQTPPMATQQHKGLCKTLVSTCNNAPPKPQVLPRQATQINIKQPCKSYHM